MSPRQHLFIGSIESLAHVQILEDGGHQDQAFWLGLLGIRHTGLKEKFLLDPTFEI
jgi:hypothetical protein